MQNYKNLLEKLQKVFFSKMASKIISSMLINEILRSDDLDYQTDLILFGYNNQLSDFTFENRVELIQGRWYFNGLTIDKITDEEKIVFHIELILFKIKL